MCESESMTDDRFFLFNQTLREEEDFYIENGFRVMTAIYLKNRGYCCGNGCRHCPYHPKHTKGNHILKQ